MKSGGLVDLTRHHSGTLKYITYSIDFLGFDAVCRRFQRGVFSRNAQSRAIESMSVKTMIKLQLDRAGNK